MIGAFTEVTFLGFMCAFHLPFAWYIKLETASTRFEAIGGIWTVCTSLIDMADSEWSCKEIDKDLAEDGLQHEWSAYGAMKTFVLLSQLVAVAAVVLFYVSICMKSKIVCAITVACTGFQFFAVMVASPLATSTFSEAYGQDTEAAWSLFLIWLAWFNSIGNLALAIVALIAAILDKD